MLPIPTPGYQARDINFASTGKKKSGLQRGRIGASVVAAVSLGTTHYPTFSAGADGLLPQNCCNARVSDQPSAVRVACVDMDHERTQFADMLAGHLRNTDEAFYGTR